jgi:hypothetical protein
MVEITGQFANPIFMKSHISNLHDYLLDPEGTPLRANVNTFIDLGLTDVLHETEKAVDDMPSTAENRGTINEVKDEINALYESLY